MVTPSIVKEIVRALPQVIINPLTVEIRPPIWMFTALQQEAFTKTGTASQSQSLCLLYWMINTLRIVLLWIKLMPSVIHCSQNASEMSCPILLLYLIQNIWAPFAEIDPLFLKCSA